MGIFDKLKNSKREIDNKINEVEILSKKNCETAITYAKSFDKEFDYSKNSIDDLEEILDYYSKDMAESQPTENQNMEYGSDIWLIFGRSDVENGLSEKGYVWGKDSASVIPLLIKGDGNYVTPNDKAYKRLVNGDVDSIISFYDFVMKE